MEFAWSPWKASRPINENQQVAPRARTDPLRRSGTRSVATQWQRVSAGSYLCRGFRERGEDTRPGADALVVALEVVLLVRRMDVVVVETKADQEAGEAEAALEIGDDRDRSAGADQNRFLAPLLGERAPGGSQRLHVPVKRDGRATGMFGE